jgi:hypothetical protein
MKQNKHKNPYTKCRGCGKRIRISLFKYCPDCSIIANRLYQEHFTPEAKKGFWAYLRKHGRRCSLSGMLLQIDDDTSPWYLVFSRLNPKDKSKILPVSALVNAIKSFLLKKEFWYYVLAIDDHRKKHLKVKRIPLVNWHGLNVSKDCKVCDGCRRAAALKGRKYCANCARIAYRMKRARFPREAVNGVWEYIRKYGFVCYYTGMELDLDDPKSPWYLVFDHWIPRDPRKIVITSAVVNIMKNDLLEEEFWSFISRLANYHRYGTPVRKMKLAYWSRPYR